MSENQEIEINQGFDPMAILSQDGRKADAAQPTTHNLDGVDESLDGQSYFLGEVPQAHLVDPSAFLPLNSDRLVGSVNMVEKILFEVGILIEEEVGSIQKQQKRIAFWEDRIEKNKALIEKNQNTIQQNTIDLAYDKKNRAQDFIVV